jgi:hypothetical protein
VRRDARTRETCRRVCCSQSWTSSSQRYVLVSLFPATNQFFPSRANAFDHRTQHHLEIRRERRGSFCTRAIKFCGGLRIRITSSSQFYVKGALPILARKCFLGVDLSGFGEGGNYDNKMPPRLMFF